MIAEEHSYDIADLLHTILPQEVWDTEYQTCRILSYVMVLTL